MFSTAKQASNVMHQAAALGLAAVVTFTLLASVNGLATAPTQGSLLAAGAAQVALAKVVASS